MSHPPYRSNLIEAYQARKAEGAQPFFLESLGPRSSICQNSYLGIEPIIRLEVLAGKLYRNGKHAGNALDIFEHLPKLDSSKPSKSNIFPAWMGFFTYEFSRHFGLKTHEPVEGMPEAAWYYYADGMSSRDNQWPMTNDQLTRPYTKNTLGSSFSKPEYIEAIQTIQHQIRNGEVYQVNLSKQVSVDSSDINPLELYRRLRANNPSPFMGMIEGDGWAICSGSPERLFDFKHGHISARPIAGTRKRGRNKIEDASLETELRQSPKENAEHVMLADLLRNDVSRCSSPGSVHMTEALSIEKYAHVMHLVSEVIGTSNTNLLGMMQSIFPGGTITGAPKPAVMTSIQSLEPGARGPYTGSMGYISENGTADFNILIRTPYFIKDKLYFSTGGGVVIDGDPKKEWEETEHKAGSFYDSLSGRKTGVDPQAPKVFGRWNVTPHLMRGLAKPRKILFIENNDSFSYNIINYLEMLGGDVIPHATPVIPHLMRDLSRSEAIPDQVRGNNFTHILIGPGPGCPADYPHFKNIIQLSLDNDIPLLGICLGHQAIAEYFGAKIKHAKAPIHGEAHPVELRSDAIFDGIPNGSKFTRYHSLVVDNLPPSLIPLAHSSSGEIMAIGHRDAGIYGIQFHPESFISESGLQLLRNFLSLPSAPLAWRNTGTGSDCSTTHIR